MSGRHGVQYVAQCVACAALTLVVWQEITNLFDTTGALATPPPGVHSKTLEYTSGELGPCSKFHEFSYTFHEFSHRFHGFSYNPLIIPESLPDLHCYSSQQRFHLLLELTEVPRVT